MEPRIIIPEIVNEGSQRRRPDGGPGRFGRGPLGPASEGGLGPMIRALAAGVMLVVGVAAVMLLSGVVLAVVGVLLVVGWVAARLSGKRRGTRTVVMQTMRDEGPMGRTVVIERRMEYRSGKPDGAERPE